MVPWYGVLLAACLFLALRLAFLRADPPAELPHQINTAEDFFVEPTAKAHEARNRAVFGHWQTNPADRYQFWRAQSPAWVYPLSWCFRAFSTSYASLRAFSITVALLGFLAFATLARARPRGFWVGSLLLCVNFYAICYDRSGLIEVMVSSAVAAMVIALDRAWEDPLWLVGSQLAFGLAFFAKQGAVYAFPLLLGFNLWIFFHHLRRLRRGEPGTAAWRVWLPVLTAATIALAAGFVVMGEPYQRALRWNLRHMLFSTVQLEDHGRKLEAFAWRITDFSRLHKGFLGLWPVAGALAVAACVRELARLAAGRQVDRRRLLLVAWLACAWFALNLARQTDTRFFAILVLPTHLLAVDAAELWLRWARRQPRPRGAAAPLLVAVALGLGLQIAYYGWWVSTRSYEIVRFNALVQALIPEDDAVVIGRWSAPLVHETRLRHYYVKWGFNTERSTMAALGITHAIWREKDEETLIHLRKFGRSAEDYELLGTQELRGEELRIVRFARPLGRPPARPVRTSRHDER